MSSGYSAHEVANKLRRCKNRLEEEVRQLAASLERQLPGGYEFREAGSFWTYLLRDVTDVDLMFTHRATGPSAVSVEDAEGLRNAAGGVLQAVSKYRVVFVPSNFGNPRVEEEYDNWDDCRRMIIVRVSHSCFYRSHVCLLLGNLDCGLLP
jgi:hypothetical protein